MLPENDFVVWHFLIVFGYFREYQSGNTGFCLNYSLFFSELILFFLNKIAHFTDFDEVANKKSSLDPESHKNLEKKRESVLVNYIAFFSD